MAKLPLVARILLGLIFTVFGVMGLFQLAPRSLSWKVKQPIS